TSSAASSKLYYIGPTRSFANAQDDRTFNDRTFNDRIFIGDIIEFNFEFPNQLKLTFYGSYLRRSGRNCATAGSDHELPGYEQLNFVVRVPGTGRPYTPGSDHRKSAPQPVVSVSL